MTGIRLLDQDTVNKIAAGEVIERPASVVKELVENSIDAGASRVLIEVVDGGKGLIRVTDDGRGIDSDDVALAFERHATSKIASAKDLFDVKTLGFRGEALSSIAAVVRSVEVLTRTGTKATGTYLRIDNGQVSEVKDAGAPGGTRVTVKGLFHNIPARRKHLKGASTEMARIADIVTEMAIINHRISFELFSGQRTIFKSRRSETWDDCLLSALGLEVVKGLMPVEAAFDGGRLRGVVASHLLARSSPDWILIYVNGRPVSSRAITRAIREGYRTLIPAGKSPVAVLALDVSPELVDANVHPTKREVRFLREEEVAEAVTSAVFSALQAGISETPEKRLKGLLPRDGQAGRTAQRDLEITLAEMGPELAARGRQRTLPMEQSGGDLVEDSVGVEQGTQSPAPARKEGLRILGQVMELYILAEGDGLLLVDQHAAAERIRYELIRQRYSEKRLSQELIVPVTLELTPREMVLMEAWSDTLRDLGFEMAPFGGNSYNVRAVPATGYRLESPEAVHDVLRDLFALGKVGETATSRDGIFKLLACRSSIKAGRVLSHEEMRQLLRDLFACTSPMTCPHGRPTMITVSSAQLEKIFGRR